MSPEEYKESLKKIKKDYEESIIKLNRSFVFENRKFQKGEIIYDKEDVIKIDKVLFYFKHDKDDTVPSISYSGEKLTSKGEPRKNKKTATIHEKEAKKFIKKAL